MIQLDVDVGDFLLMCDAADYALGEVMLNIRTLADAGARRLRDTDHYQNRTGQLRAGTQAHGGEAGFPVVLEMDMYYASFVHNLGYSHFDEVAAWVDREVDRGIDTMLDRL